MKETFGQKLSRIRKTRGMTQEELAEKVNVSPQAVSKWENDMTQPDIETLVTLSDIFGISLDELMGKEKTETKVIPEKQRKDINSMLIRLNMEEKDGGKATINIPLALVTAFLDADMKVPFTFGHDKIERQIDFRKIIELVELGVVGELMSLEDEDGSTCRIYVE